MKPIEARKYFKAKDRIKKIKNFRWFVLASILASVYMIGFSAFLHLNESKYSFVPIAIFLATILGLWIIVLTEYVKTFKTNAFFLRAWEARQIQKYIERDNKSETF